MSQTPPNSGWQGGPQGPGQPWNGPQQGQQPGYQGGQPQQGFGQNGPQQNFGQNGPQQNFGQRPPQGQGFGQQSGPQQGFGQQGPQQGFGQNGPQQGFGQNGPQQGFGQQNGPQQGPQNFGQQNGPQSYGQQDFGQQGGAPTQQKSKAKYIIAGVVALALIAAGIGVGMFFFKGSTPAAAKGLPADVAFAFEVNLAPANADKLALKGIIDKYPSLKTDEDFGGDYKQALWNVLAKESPDMPDYSEVEPWLGDSFAMGIVGTTSEDMNDENNYVMAVETTDKGKAEAFIKAEAEDMKVQFIDNLMVVTEASSTIDVADIKKASLADSDQYKADMAKIGDSSLASAWFGPAMIDAAIEQAEDTSGFDASGIDTQTMKGTHGAMGLKVSENKLSMQYAVQTPNAPEASSDDVAAFAKDLSGDALLVAALGTNDDMFEQYWKLAESQDAAESLAQFGITGPQDLKALIGKKVGLTVGVDGESPVVGAKLETEDAAKQKQILDKIAEAVGSSPEFPLTVGQDGDNGLVAFGQDTDAITNPGSKLGDLDGFKQVVDGKAAGLLYINIEGLKSQPFYEDMIGSVGDEFSEVLDPITAIGMVANPSADHYQEGALQVTFK